jgi:hypothetical protein
MIFKMAVEQASAKRWAHSHSHMEDIIVHQRLPTSLVRFLGLELCSF